MVGEIRRAVGEVIGIEKWEWVDEDCRGSDRDKKGNDRMSRDLVAISSENVSQRVLVVEDRRLGGP